MTAFHHSRRLFCRNSILFIVLLSLMVSPRPTSASTATTTFAVSATVLSVCIVVATELLFGNYTSSNATPTTATSTVTVTCTPGTTYTVALGAGNGVSATNTSRSMTSLIGSTSLNYALYTNSSHTTIWGDGTNSTATNGGTAVALPTTYTVYGQIAASQYVASGAYGDTIAVTVTY